MPQTIDNTREADPTIVQPDDEEALAGVAEDEFAAHFARDVEPSLLVTTSRKPSGRIFEFLSNLFETLPNATYYARKAYPVRIVALRRGVVCLHCWAHAQGAGEPDLQVCQRARLHKPAHLQRGD